MLEKMEKELAALEQVEETGGVDRLGDKSHLYHVIEDEDVSGDENGENPGYEVIQERTEQRNRRHNYLISQSVLRHRC